MPDAMTFPALHLIESVSRVAATSLVSGILEGAALVGLVALCLHLVPRTTAAARFAVWAAVFLVLAILPFVQVYPGQPQAETTAHAALFQMDIRWSFIVVDLWAVLSAVRAIKLAMSIVRLRSLWSTARPIEACGRLPLLPAGSRFRSVELCTSDDVDRPSVIGFFSPRILIPTWLYRKLNPDELLQIVLHEMGHLRRADDWINLLQKSALVLFPLNPILLWIEKRLCFERELACDEAVLQFTRSPGAYAECLTSLAERSLVRRKLSLSLGAWERQSELARRVHSILRRGEKMPPRQARLVLGAVMLVLLTGAGALSRCPQIVSFAPAATAHHLAAAREARNEGRRTSATEYRPVSFRTSIAQGRSGAFERAAAPHETLLKASIPVAAAEQNPAKRHRPGQSSGRRSSAVQHLSTVTAPVQSWVVLTSWDDSGRRSPVVLTVTKDQFVSPRYAAEPTEYGWLIVQL